MTFIKFVWFNIFYVDITCKYVLFFYENVLFNNILKGYLMPTETFRNYYTTQCPFLNLELSSMQQQISFHSSIFGKNQKRNGMEGNCNVESIYMYIL